LRFGLLEASPAVPVPVCGRGKQIGERIDVRAGPDIELVVPSRREVRLVVGQCSAGMPVDRDDRVPALGFQGSVLHVTSAIASIETLPRDTGLGIVYGNDGAALLRIQPHAELTDRNRLRPE